MRKKETAKGFTIVELLTVMSIIVILMSLLVPALNNVRRHARDVKQDAQFHAIGVALDLYNNEFGDYPDSGELDPCGVDYCGAMKLTEAMLGQDLLGFHPESIFERNGFANGNQLYPDSGTVTAAVYKANLQTRKGPYLQVDSANAHMLKNLYGTGVNVGPFNEDQFVMCDVYTRVTVIGNLTDDSMVGRKVGMPILYYKADTTAYDHDPNDPEGAATENIYNYHDNHELVVLGMPWDLTGTKIHKLCSDATAGEVAGERFYLNTLNEKIATADRPYNADSYILISAGYDGEYGTVDDVYNFNN